jgi:hypothetical protein
MIGYPQLKEVRMDKFLTQVKMIWTDLEVSYSERGKEGESRRKFLLRIAGSQDGTTNQLDRLKASVLERYEGNEQLCTQLAEFFDVINNNWDKVVAGPEIENLNDFAFSLMGETSGPTLDASIDPNELIAGLNPYEVPKVTPLSVAQVLKSVGFLSDIYEWKDNRAMSYVVDSKLSEGLVLINSLYSEREFLENYAKNISNPFLHSVYQMVSHFRQKEIMSSYCLFVKPQFYTSRAGKVNLLLDGEKFPVTLIDRKNIGSVECLHCSLDNDYVTFPVYCVL